MVWRITPAFKNKLLLDQYPNAAAAYSLRNLTILSNAPVVRVRRSSDNTEQDFTAAQVADETLTTFCGAGNGFVRTWYDQSGNSRHLEQSTNANQLRIVNAGALETSGGKPAIASPAGYLTLTRTWGIAPNNPATFLVKSYTATYSFGYSGHWLDIGSSNINNHFAAPGVDPPYINYFNSARPKYGTTRFQLNTRYLESFQHVSGVGSLRVNGAAAGTNNFSAITPTSLVIGGSSGTYPSTGFIQELIIYSNGSVINISSIEGQINSHYSIY